MFLLYLNNKTFLDAGCAVARLVQAAMDHEQEPSCGGVPSRNSFQQTPQVLQQPPYKLFDTVAVLLYPAPEHRTVSLRLVLSSMGAVPSDCGTAPAAVAAHPPPHGGGAARVVRRRPAEPRQEPQHKRCSLRVDNEFACGPGAVECTELGASPPSQESLRGGSRGVVYLC